MSRVIRKLPTSLWNPLNSVRRTPHQWSEESYPHSRASRFKIQSTLMFFIQYVRCDNSEDFLSSILRIFLSTHYVHKGGNCAWTTGKWSSTYIVKSYQFLCMHASLEAVTLVKSSHSPTHRAKYIQSHCDSPLIYICADTCCSKAREQTTLNVTLFCTKISWKQRQLVYLLHQYLTEVAYAPANL